MTGNNIKSVLLTGATGFVGTNLLKSLVDCNYNISILKLAQTNLPDNLINNKSINCYIYDGSNQSVEKVFNEISFDVVIHLASLVLSSHDSDDIPKLVNSNILFGTQLLENMKANNVKFFINTSTFWTHFNNEDYNPVNLYAATKKSFEDILIYYHKAFNISYITLELCDNYGLNDPRRKLFYWLKKSIDSKEVIAITEGEQVLSFVHISDVVNAYIIAMELISKESAVLSCNYAIRDKSIKIKDLVLLFERISGKKLNIEMGARPYNTREVMQTYNNCLILPGWKPLVKLEDGVREIINE